VQCCDRGFKTLRSYLSHRRYGHGERIRECLKKQCAYDGCGYNHTNLTTHEKIQHYTCICGYTGTGYRHHGEGCKLTPISPFEYFKDKEDSPENASRIAAETVQSGDHQVFQGTETGTDRLEDGDNINGLEIFENIEDVVDGLRRLAQNPSSVRRFDDCQLQRMFSSWVGVIGKELGMRNILPV
jgi:hypothetical protein